MGMNHQRALRVVGLAVLLGTSAAACDDSGSGLASSLMAGSGSGFNSGLDVTCTDAGFPVVAPVLTASSHQIWPPNHKFHSFDVADCVTVNSCDPNLHAEFIWGSSDEPVDDIGDGHFAPDILFDDCGHVQVRSERQGPKNGRVYKLGVRVVDGAGHSAESACTIIVDHDQRGTVGADSGESYRVFPTQPNGLVCDGLPAPLPPSVPPSVPPIVVDASTPPGIPIGI